MSRGVVKAISQGIVKGITQLRDWVFDPTLLNPYLFVNAQDSPLSPLQAPTLDLDPSVPSSLDIITATRAGTATVTDASGLIQEATANTVRVDHLQGELITAARTNLMGYSEPTLAQYSSIFGGGISEVVIADSGLTQWTQWDDTTGATRYVNKTPFPFTIGQTYVFSFYLRMNDGGAPVVGNSSTGVSADLAILIEGSSNAGTAGGMESVGSGLYRVWGKRTITTTSGEARIYKYNNQSARGFRVSGLQVEQATAPTALIDNHTGGQITIPAVYGPRVPMILCEPAATNLVPSKVFTANGTATIASGFLAPDGSMDAYELSNILDATGDRSYSDTATVSGSTEYTGSLYVKGTAGEVSAFYTKRAAGATFASSPTVLVTLTGSWQRVTGLTFTTAADNTGARVYVINTGSTSTADTIQVWRAQFEAGSVATSYIPTSGSAVTRAADNLSITGSAFSDFFNGSEGTFYIEAVDRQPAESAHTYISGQGTSQFFLYTHTSAIVRNYDGTNLLSLGPIVANQLFRAAVSYKTSGSVKSLSLNGTSEVDQPYSDSFAATNILKIGHGYTDVFSGHFRRILFWPPHSDSL